jgi:hypothetical protein
VIVGWIADSREALRARRDRRHERRRAKDAERAEKLAAGRTEGISPQHPAEKSGGTRRDGSPPGVNF